MNRAERMPWSQIAQNFSEGGGIWAFVSAIFTAACFAAVGMFKVRTSSTIARDENLAQRENALIQHLADEVSRLNALVADLDIAMKAQASEHREAMQRERDECNAKMAGLQGEIEILKRRMNEESR